HFNFGDRFSRRIAVDQGITDSRVLRAAAVDPCHLASPSSTGKTERRTSGRRVRIRNEYGRSAESDKIESLPVAEWQSLDAFGFDQSIEVGSPRFHQRRFTCDFNCLRRSGQLKSD